MKNSGFKPKSIEHKLKLQKAAQERARKKRGTKSKKTTKKATRAKSKRKKTPSIRQLKDKLWEECKRITRTRFPNTCYTCGKPGLEGSDWQTGHGKPKGALPLRFQYDIRNLRPQCMLCNVHRGGVTDVFISKLEQEEEGYQFLKEACYFDDEDMVWRIRHDGELLRGIESTRFIEKLLEEYRNFHP